MHYKILKDGLLFVVYSTVKLSKYSKIHISALFLTMHWIFGKLKYFWTSLKSGSAKTRPVRPILPQLNTGITVCDVDIH